MTARITVDQLNTLLTAFQPLRCWQFGRYLGSMLTLDLGDQLEVNARDSAIVAEGSLTIAIRNVLWVAIDGERAITNAEDINEEMFASNIKQRLIGAMLNTVEKTADGLWIAFRFNNGFSLKVDTLNTWKTESDVFEITMPDGRIIVLDETGALEIPDETEPFRARRWRSRLS